MASPVRGALKITLGAGALYFLVMRNLETPFRWHNTTYLKTMQERELNRALAQEKQQMLAESS